ncbi:hypothetical protein [Streptomyces sp. 7-21]|uniref:hypothetical protein n=1 Tax=Streptomyces sp. 7-21 TaxID=2802283 RepID=UPI00191DAAC8|nr:hypothetical protein [Streptomyces sp. 7-21]MBL1068118.1 hypothetical protein [Streptomyces sp. 7-21]
MDFSQLAMGLVLVRRPEDDGSGPPPAVPGHEADRRVSRAAARHQNAPAGAGKRRRLRPGRGRQAAPAAVT